MGETCFWSDTKYPTMSRTFLITVIQTKIPRVPTLSKLDLEELAIPALRSLNDFEWNSSGTHSSWSAKDARRKADVPTKRGLEAVTWSHLLPSILSICTKLHRPPRPETPWESELKAMLGAQRAAHLNMGGMKVVKGFLVLTAP